MVKLGCAKNGCSITFSDIINKYSYRMFIGNQQKVRKEERDYSVSQAWAILPAIPH